MADSAAMNFGDLDMAAKVRQCVRDEDVVSAIENNYECIEILVGSELDTTASGPGLGRMSQAIPRFGSKFRRRLTDSMKLELGSSMESLCLAGACAAVIYASLLDLGHIRRRSIDDVFPLWVPHFAVALDGVDEEFMAVLNSVAGEAADEFVELCQQNRVVRGKQSDRAAAEATGALLAGAGAGLVMFLHSMSDSRF